MLLDNVLEFISCRIQGLREAKDISARDLSLSLGWNSAYINKIENKQAKPSLDGLCYICDYFSISLAEFFDENTEHPMKVNEVLALVKRLDADSLDLIINMAKKLGGGK